MRGPQFRQTTGYILAQTCKLLRTRAHALLEEVGLYRGQQFILHALWEREGVTHSDLADQLQVQAATITNTLKRMEKAGLVERRHDERDQRISRVYLTDAGREIRSAVEDVLAQLEEQTFAGFDAEEKGRMRQFLRRIQDNLIREQSTCRSRQ